MGLGALGAAFHHFLPRLICLPEFAAFQVVGDQLAGSEDPIGVELQRTLVCFIRPLEHGLAAVGVVGVVVATQSELLPGRSVGGIDFDHMLQDCDGVLVRPGIMGQGQAVKVKIVRFRVLRASARIEEAAGDAERRQQLLAYLRRHLRLQCDQVLRGRGHVALPQKLVPFHLNCLERNHQAVALLEEVSGKYVGDVDILASLLRIDVVADKLPRDR